MRRRRKETLIALALAAATLAAFGHAVGNGFVNFDDDLYVTDNPHVRGGLTGPGVRWALTTTALANWHPLTLLSFQLDAELFGPDAWGFHLTNLLLHAANAAVLFLVLARWTGAAWRSALAAALFAWHPLHVESFAWVAERKDVLSTLLGLLTLAAYGRFAERPGWRRYAFVVVAFALGLAAKPMLVTLPAVLLLLDYWPLGRFSPHLTPRPPTLRGKGEKSAPPFPRREGGPGGLGETLRLLAEKLPLFALAAASAAVTLLAQHRAAGVRRVPELSLRVENALVSCVTYLGQAVWPLDLGPYYPFPREHFPAWQWAGAALLVAAMTGLAVLFRRRCPYLLVGWLWYLITLVPVLGLVPIVGGHGTADRYTYVPLMGVFVAVAWCLGDLAERWHAQIIVVPLTATALGLLLLLSWLQVHYWRDSRTLWQHALEVTPANALAHNNLGVVLEQRGDVEEAAGHYEAAVRIDPEYATARTNLGAALERLGRRREAVAQYRAALQIEPTPANLVNLGRACLEAGDADEAARLLESAAASDPADGDASFYLGRVFGVRGQWDKAADCFRRATELQPGLARNRCALAYALANQGQTKAADEQYAESLRLDPSWPQVMNQTAWVLATHPDPNVRHGPHAVELARMVCQATADRRPDFLDTLAAAYAEAGRWDNAVATARKAVEVAASKSPELAEQIRARLRRYEGRRPLAAPEKGLTP